MHVISNVHSVTEKAPKLDGRRNLLFVGNYVHMPNRDAARHFVADLWPQMRTRLGGAVVRFVGLPVREQRQSPLMGYGVATAIRRPPRRR